MLGYDTDMMSVKSNRGFQWNAGYIVAGYRDGGNAPSIRPPFLPGDRAPRCVLVRNNVVYFVVFYLSSHQWLHYRTTVRSTGKPSTLRKDDQTVPMPLVRSVVKTLGRCYVGHNDLEVKIRVFRWVCPDGIEQHVSGVLDRYLWLVYMYSKDPKKKAVTFPFTIEWMCVIMLFSCLVCIFGLDIWISTPKA